tara:strand:+ start:135 stop:917 length:783 start_codon:yes stop_codon:yes gene_type:complete
MASEVDTTVGDLERRMGVTGKSAETCPEHGGYIAIHRDGHQPSGCPVCARVEREREEEEQKRAEFVWRHLPIAQIPKRFADRSLNNYQVKNEGQRRALEVCTEYADNFDHHKSVGRCLLLLGKVGTGKTHLACGIANRLLRRMSRRAVYRTVGDILIGIRASYSNRDEESETELLRPILGADLLILDEVGATKPSEFELATLYRIINGRYESCLPTVIVSNLAATELGEAIGERCFDRIKEGGAVVVPFSWASARGEATP